MLDPIIGNLFYKTMTYAACGAIAATFMHLFNQQKEGIRWEQSAGIGALVGGAFGAFFGIFEAMMDSKFE